MEHAEHPRNSKTSRDDDGERSQFMLVASLLLAFHGVVWFAMGIGVASLFLK